jgi:hypothetical protein
MFPDSSVAVQVMVVRPTGNTAESGTPSLRAPDTTTFGQLSTAVAVAAATVVVDTPRSVLVEMLAGAVIIGCSLSTTVTVCLLVAVSPPASVAVHVIVVTPLG